MISIEGRAERLEADTSEPEEQLQRRGWKHRVGDYAIRMRVIYLVLKHPQSPFLAKAIATLSIGYIFSPIQLIPSFIPVIGWLDDVAVLSVGRWLLVRLTPAEVLQQCQQDATRKRSKRPLEIGVTRGPRTPTNP